MEKKKVIALVGPTASGKTALSIALAKKIHGEIISCDSMQIYKDMNIGTAKPDEVEKQGILHYLLDIISPEQRFSVSDYKKQAILAIEEIIQKQKVPIIVGGTGLYMDSLVYGIDFPEITFDEKYRKQLEDKSLQPDGLQELYKQAAIIDPEAIKTISPNDKKRIIRILEIYKQTGKNKTEQNKESLKNGIPYDYKIFGLQWEREALYERINQRVDHMIQQGLIEEVKTIQEKYHVFPTAMQGLGYKEVVEYLEQKISKEEMIEKIKQDTRHYAKRQMTWFRKNKDIIWLEGKLSIETNVRQIIEQIEN